ncbi:hypothetical protein VitviT2T_001684 [Vitis vinifera]|uniref:RRM domain-containing protein n=2 Tax=Vitis vinifera TaxID=29760 RepID=A0ABY9BH23_VITVI|nr:hypothetical protein VitviT2T_001684 [Vitis vinifera]
MWYSSGFIDLEMGQKQTKATGEGIDFVNITVHGGWDPYAFNSPDSPTPSSKYKASPSQPPPHPNLCSRVSLFDSNPEMPYSREGRSVSPANSGSPIRGRRSRSRSRSRSLSRSRRSRSRSRDSVDAVNPGNNLYVTGLSTRVNASDLEKYFNSEGKVVECHLVTDPRTRESRGFGFVTMETVEDADRCIKYLNRSVLEGRLITVEKVQASVTGFN